MRIINPIEGQNPELQFTKLKMLIQIEDADLSAFHLFVADVFLLQDAKQNMHKTVWINFFLHLY
jgi:hypothetical protein